MKSTLRADKARLLLDGICIPAHPLVLDDSGRLDERRQMALSRYYLDAGAGGLAIGVHTTQFEIREHGLLPDVLRLGAEVAAEALHPVVMIAGVCGGTEQAVSEAYLAAEHGYDIALVTFRGLDHLGERELVEHVAHVGEVLPVMGFYLQPAVGGRSLGYRFWRSLSELEAVAAVKVAPFDRYATLELVRGVVDSERWQEIALYTGNDDHILLDLLTVYELRRRGGNLVRKPIVGSLLGQNAVWLKPAVELFQAARQARVTGVVGTELLTLAAQLTEANSAIFDAAGGFAGCIVGIHEVLRGQGLVENVRLLDASVKVSEGQADNIARVIRAYPHLIDDDYVLQNRDRWLQAGPA